MTNNEQTIKCVILTMRRENVILPSENIAEIISVKDVSATQNESDWYLGKMSWRGMDVPLVSFEAAAGEDVSTVNLNTQAVVVHVDSEESSDDDEKFLGLVMSGVPHVTHVSREQIVTDEFATQEHPMVAQRVRINGARVSILDIDAMASMVN